MKRRWTSAAARRVTECADVADVDGAIDRIAQRLLDGVVCPPTDLDALFGPLNVDRVEARDDIRVTGALIKERDKFVIHVFPGLATGRRRFTIAHELGHAFMESTGPGAPRTGRELEQICDRFAAEILMPRRELLGYVGRSPNIARALQAATTFRTSRSAIFLRLFDLLEIMSCEFENGVFNWAWGLNNFEKSSLRRLLGDTDKCKGRRLVALNSGRNYSKLHLEWCQVGAPQRFICLLTPA